MADEEELRNDDVFSDDISVSQEGFKEFVFRRASLSKRVNDIFLMGPIKVEYFVSVLGLKRILCVENQAMQFVGPNFVQFEKQSDRLWSLQFVISKQWLQSYKTARVKLTQRLHYLVGSIFLSFTVVWNC